MLLFVCLFGESQQIYTEFLLSALSSEITPGSAGGRSEDRGHFVMNAGKTVENLRGLSHKTPSHEPETSMRLSMSQ